MLTTLAIGLMCLNIKPTLENSTATKVKLADYFVTEAFALTPEEEEAVLTGFEEDDEEIIGGEFTEEEEAEYEEFVEGKERGEGEGAGEEGEDVGTEEEFDEYFGEEPTEPVDQEFLKRTGQLLNWVHYIFGPLIFAITNYIGGLLSTDYLFAGKMGEMLKSIWIISRNIVNIVFVLILLYLAIKQIFFAGEGEGKTELKKALPNFVIMLVAINFSWLAVRVVIDAANVATNVVFAIPSGVRGVVGACEIVDDKPNRYCMPGNIYYDFDSKKYVNRESGRCPTKEEVQEAKTTGGELSESRVFCWQNLDYSRFSKNNAAYYLTYGIARVQNLTQANVPERGEAVGLREISKAAIGFIFSVILELVYLIAFACLLLALIFRVVFLWIFIAFSPFLVLIYYLQKDMPELVGESGKALGIGQFFQWAFVPVKVGAVFAVGFIMLSTGQVITEFFLSTAEKGGGIGLDFKTLFQGIDNLQELLWFLMTTIVIWMGVFAVLAKLQGASFVFDHIKNYFKRAGVFAAKAGAYAPIFPLGEAGKKVSIAEAMEPFDIRKRFETMLTRYKKPSRADQLADSYHALRGKDFAIKEMHAAMSGPAPDYKKFISLMVRHSNGKFSEDLIRDSSKYELERYLKQFGKGWEKYAQQLKDIVGKKAETRAEAAGTAVAPAAPAAAGILMTKEEKEKWINRIMESHDEPREVAEERLENAMKTVTNEPQLHAALSKLEKEAEAAKAKKAGGGPPPAPETPEGEGK